MSSIKFVLAGALSLFALTSSAMGQSLYQDIQREFADENQLQRDVRRYQHDVSTGHYLRAAVDRARIQNDEANIRFDQSRVQTDLSYQGSGLMPHPQYPGYYYYPTQPGQLYTYQNPQGAPPPAQVTASAPVPTNYVGAPASGVVPPTYVGPPAQGSSPISGIVPANPVTFNVGPPLKTITVYISNPGDTGVPINFAVDGTAYNVPSGYTQRLVGTASSIVEFDRGDLFGDGRYRLTDGSYEFRYTDKGWELYKRPANPPVPSSVSTTGLPRNVPPRSVASSANANPTVLAPTSLSPIVPDPTPVKETVPLPPAPDPSVPR